MVQIDTISVISVAVYIMLQLKNTAWVGLKQMYAPESAVSRCEGI